MIGERVARFLERQKLGYVATVSADGTPNLSPKGTIIALDSKTLAFADIRSPNTVRNLEANPSLEINVVDPLLRKGFRFAGRARIVRDGRAFGEILGRYRRDGVRSRVKAIVIVDVLGVSEVTSPLYDLGLTEDEVRARWRARMLGA